MQPTLISNQVILSFLITAWFSFAVALVTFLFADNPLPTGPPSRLDLLIIKIARKPFSRKGKLLWSPPRKLMQDVCLMLGDQQLVTGASILVVCLSTHNDITQYHFIIGGSLAFTSFATFQAILFIAGDALHKHRLKKIWRFPWIVFITVAATLCNFVFQDQNFLVPDQWGTATQCVWDILGTYDEASKARLAIWTIVAFDSLMSIVKFLWPSVLVLQWYNMLKSAIPSLPLLAMSWVDEAFLRPAHGRLRRFVGFVLQIPLLCCFWVVFAIFEIYFSASFDLFRTYLIMVTTTIGIYSIRSTAREYYLTGSEDTWGFGQIMPMLLLALPVFAAVEVVFGKSQTRPTKQPIPEYLSVDQPFPWTAKTTDVHLGNSPPDGPFDTVTRHNVSSSPEGNKPTSAAEEVAPATQDGLEIFPPRPIVRSLTAFAAARASRDNGDIGTRGSNRTGFWKLLELQDLTVEEVEDLIYGNKLFSGLMLVVLGSAYIGVTACAILFDFIL